jgi:hypothetical protein
LLRKKQTSEASVLQVMGWVVQQQRWQTQAQRYTAVEWWMFVFYCCILDIERWHCGRKCGLF